MTAADLSSFAGLTAMVLLTVNLLLGLLVTTNYRPDRQWPRRKLPVPLFRIHNWMAYAAIAAVAFHPAILLFSTAPRFQIVDVLWPAGSPGQRVYNMFGAFTLYGFVLVVVSSYLRPRLGYRPWKKLHWMAYAAGALMFLHGTLIDPNLKNQPTDFLDGEKLLVEGCFVLIVAATVWRWRYGKERQRYGARRAASQVP